MYARAQYDYGRLSPSVGLVRYIILGRLPWTRAFSKYLDNTVIDADNDFYEQVTKRGALSVYCTHSLSICSVQIEICYH